MKIRFGFVSNSSTTHFVALGWKLDEEDIRAYIEKMHPEWLQVKSHIGIYEMYQMMENVGCDEPIITLDGVILGQMIASTGQNGEREELEDAEIDSDLIDNVVSIGKKHGYRKPELIFGSWSSD